MRAVNRNLKKVYFYRTDDTPLVFRTIHGDEIVQWNTDPEQVIESYETQPLKAIPKRRHSQPLDVLYL